MHRRSNAVGVSSTGSWGREWLAALLYVNTPGGRYNVSNTS